MKINEAHELLEKYVTSTTLQRHCLTVSVVMKYWAETLGEDNPEFWECVGLLHDIDYEQFPEKHCVKAKEILENEKANYPGISDELIHAVQSHGWNICCDVEPVHRMEKVLYTIDELTGLIFACAMARPSRSVMDLEVKSVTKKFKTQSFAAGCNREIITNGMNLMKSVIPDIDDDEIINRCILAMRTKAAILGVGSLI
ncbi:MAG: HD domain-containing protein [Treponemataceae bacterium]|nr:HD domain-containing protein [Treponemataceae bacterium]